jgi:hypothetical protein
MYITGEKIINGWIIMLMPKIVILYYPEENVFKSPQGKVYTNLQPLITPSQIFLFKHNKKSVEFINREFGINVKILYPMH